MSFTDLRAGLVALDWDELKHPRGQPENAGEFASAGGGGAKKEHTAATAEWKHIKYDITIPGGGKGGVDKSVPWQSRVIVNPSRNQAEAVLKGAGFGTIQMGRDKNGDMVLLEAPRTMDQYTKKALAEAGHEFAGAPAEINGEKDLNDAPATWFAVEQSQEEIQAQIKKHEEDKEWQRKYAEAEAAKRPPKRTEPLPHSDTPGKKYIRFGTPPLNERSEVQQLPNAMMGMMMKPEDYTLAGVSVFPVAYNKDRNTWDFDGEALADSGMVGLDELIATSAEHGRPIYLVQGEEQDEEGTDGEPLLRNVKIIDDTLTPYDLNNEGYYDPETDSPEWPGKGYSRHAHVVDNLMGKGPMIYTTDPADAKLAKKQGKKFKLVKHPPIPEKFRVAKDSVRADWDESQHPRGQPENKGEFAKAPGGGADEPDMFGKLQGIEFVSPNIKEGTKLKEARRGLKQARHKFIVNAGAEVDKALGVAAETKPVIGMWADGAENSTMSIMENPPWETLVKSAAMKGWLAQQKQVLIFKEGDNDPTHGDEAGLASFSAKGDAAEISQWLGDNGLPYHTLEPTKGGFTIFVYGNDADTGHALVKAGEHYASEVTVRRGRGAFLGTHKEDGSDAEQRADARAEYDRLLVQSGDQRTAKLWKGLRDRLGPQADQVVSDQTETPHFKAWFGKSKIVDEDGAPLVLYHGTLGNFESFDQSRGVEEANWGKGIYFTNDADDMSHNYAGRGPDVTNKLEKMAEEIEQEDDFEGDHAEALRRAETQLKVAHEGAAIPAFIKMETPFKIGGKGETHLDYTLEEDEEGNITGQSGKAAELIEAIHEIGQDPRLFDAEGIKSLEDDLAQHALEEDGIQASKLELIAAKASNFGYVTNTEGHLMASEILRQALEKVGFDGIIDTRVSQKFAGMKHMHPDTTHYIVFDPHQVKSAIGNKGTFSPTSTKITDSQVRADAYNPNEARIPKGQPGGGQWTSGGGGLGFVEAPNDDPYGPEGEKMWKHPATGGTLTIEPSGKWWFTGGKGNTLEGMGKDEETLSNFLYLHKGDLKPKFDPNTVAAGFVKDETSSNDSFAIWRHPAGILKVQHATGAWKFAPTTGTATGGDAEGSLKQFLENEKDTLKVGADLPDPLMAGLGFKLNPKISGDTVQYYSHPSGGDLMYNTKTDAWEWTSNDVDEFPDAKGGFDTLPNWLSTHQKELTPKGRDLIDLMPKLGMAENISAATTDWRTFKFGADIIHINEGTGEWKWKPGSGGETVTGMSTRDLLDDLSHSTRGFRMKAKELLDALPSASGEAITPQTWVPHPKVLNGFPGADNQRLAAKLEADFVKVAPELDALANTLYEEHAPIERDEERDQDGGTGELPSDWDAVPGEAQQKAEEKWKENHYDSEYDYQVQSWQETGQPLHDAKMWLSENEDEYVTDGIDRLFSEWDDETYGDIPYTKEQLKLAVETSFADKYEDGASDIEVEFHDNELKFPSTYAVPPGPDIDPRQGALEGIGPPGAPVGADPEAYFTEGMRDALTNAIQKEFNIAAQRKADHEEPPEYLKESANESLGETWDQMMDGDKLDTAKNLLDEDDWKDAGVSTEKISGLDHPPRKFDPLNDEAGTPDYKRTQNLAGVLSVRRGMDVLKQRGLLKGPPPTASSEGMAKKFTEAQATWQDGPTDEQLKTMMMQGRGVAEVAAVHPHMAELLQYAYDMVYSPPVENVAYGGDWTKNKAGAGVSLKDAENASQRFAVKLVHAADLSGQHVKFHEDILDKELSPQESEVFHKYREKIASNMANALVNRVGREQSRYVDYGDPHANVSKIDSKIWKGWVRSSTGTNGKLLQIAAAEELGGQLRIPTAPKLTPEPITEATDAELAAAALPKTTDNTDLRQAIYAHVGAAMRKNRDKLPPELKGFTAVASTAVINLMDPVVDKDGHGRLEFRKPFDEMEPQIRQTIEKLRPEIDEAVRKGFTQRREDINAKRRESAEQAAKLKYGHYEPTPDAQVLALANATDNYTRNHELGAHYLSKVVEISDLLQIPKEHYHTQRHVADALATSTTFTREDGNWKAHINFASKKFEDLNNEVMHDITQKLADLRFELATKASRYPEDVRMSEDGERRSKALKVYDDDAKWAWEPKEDLIASADRDYPEIGGYAGVKALMRAKWETSQWLMAKAGVHELEVYRGIDDPRVNLPTTTKEDVIGRNGQMFQKLPQYNLLRNGAQSTALKASVSNGWGDNATRVVLRLRVPRTAVLSLPAYGRNVHSEREVVVTGGAWKDWDAYKETAPQFDQFALARNAAPPAKPKTLAEQFDYGITDYEAKEMGLPPKDNEKLTEIAL